jgi:acyl-CoA thioesterase
MGEEAPKAADILDLIREKDTFAKKLGIEILEAADGRSKVVMPLDEGTANALGNVHGGAIFALADLALAAAANSEGVVSVSIQMDIHYLAGGPSEGTLYATAEKTAETRRLGYYRIRVFRPDGKDVAACQAMVYRKG